MTSFKFDTANESPHARSSKPPELQIPKNRRNQFKIALSPTIQKHQGVISEDDFESNFSDSSSSSSLPFTKDKKLAQNVHQQVTKLKSPHFGDKIPFSSIKKRSEISSQNSPV